MKKLFSCCPAPKSSPEQIPFDRGLEREKEASKINFCHLKSCLKMRATRTQPDENDLCAVPWSAGRRSRLNDQCEQCSEWAGLDLVTQLSPA